MELAANKKRLITPMSLFPLKSSLDNRNHSVLVLLVSIIFLWETCSCAVALPEDYLPHIQVLEIVTSPTNRTSAVNLWKERNSDVVIGEDTSAVSRVLMKCNATYPVQWVYLGDGKPEFTTFTNVKWQDDPGVPMSFEAEASLGLLGFHGVLREEDTGNYTCRSIQDPGVHSYFFIYVPGDDLFAAVNGSTITYSPQDQYLRIPCGVSHPKATATLCKRDKSEKLTCPVSGASGFNNKGGFLINLKKQRDPSGTYVCTAKYRGSVRTVEHYVMKEGDKPKPVPPLETPPTEIRPPKLGKNLCDPSPCGKQADCSVVDGRAVCYCFRGLNGNPFDECVPGKCRSSRDCPRGKFCRQGQCTSDPCNPSPCGKGGDCSIFRGQSKCACQRGYTGLPPNCVQSCNENQECPEDEACIKGICQSPCPGPCGQNAECRVVVQGPKRMAQCSCPKDALGDPLKSCFKFNSTTPGPWNNCPPGYVGQPPACSKKECDSDMDCPFGRKCTDHICDAGFNPACDGKCGQNAVCQTSPTTPDPVCVCPEGSTGNPAIFCSLSPLSPSSPIGPTSWGDACNPNPCQGPSECHIIQGSRACLCPSGFTGDPPNCVPATGFPLPSGSTRGPPGGPCRYDGECRQGDNCVEGRCQDMCKGLCGFNAVCEPAYQRKYRSIFATAKLLQPPESSCSCPPGFEGNPYVSCVPSRTRPPGPPGPPIPPALPSATTSVEPFCYPGACGRFAECSVVNNAPFCRCPPGFDGNPYHQCKEIPMSPPPRENDPSTLPRPTAGRPTHVSPVDLDSQGHSWGHHKDLNTREREPPPQPPPPPSGWERKPSPTPDGDYFEGGNRFHSKPPPSMDSSFNRDRPYPPPPPPPYYDRDDRDFHAGKVNSAPPTSHNYPPDPTVSLQGDPNYAPPDPTAILDDRRFSPDPTAHHSTIPHFPPDPTGLQVEDTPPPKTLDRPMSPLAPMSPPGIGDRDECSFKNPYADYDMDTCGIGQRCERDFRGIKRCVCISPFDCTGPTSTYSGGRCKTSRDCLLSDHICRNGSCVNPCSPEFSPCTGIAFSECRVIEGNVLCTCRRGYVGNPASGLDCRPKRYSHSSVHPVSAAVKEENDARNFVILNDNRNITGNFKFEMLSNKTHNQTNGTVEDDFNSGSDDGTSGEFENDDNDSIIISGTANTGTIVRHHRRHDGTQVGKSILNKNNALLGQCGFGSGHYCDEKSQCRIIGGRPMCVCKTGYKGEYPHCKPECEKDEDCSESMACQYHQCMDPCIEEKSYCAANAFCTVSLHTARCECEQGYIGIPWIQCSKAEESTPKNRCMGFNCKKRHADLRLPST